MPYKKGYLTQEKLQKKLESNDKEDRAESEVLNFNKADFEFIPKNCQYKQEGPYLICQSCPLKHAVFIGMNKMMVGANKDGTPILKNRDF